MKKLFIVAGLALLSTTAFAADLPRRAYTPAPVSVAPSWTGFYVGINGGGGWSTQDQTITGGNAISNTVISSGAAPSDIATRGAGGLVGGTAGYNWQFNERFVFGTELDLDWSDIGDKGGQTVNLNPIGIPYSLTTTGSEKLQWIGTLRGRLGYLVTPSTMLFVTGGGAYGSVQSTTSMALTAPAPFGPASITADSTTRKFGWTFGGGIEQQLWGGWSIKGEYRYTDLGSVGNTLATTIAPGTPNATPVAFNAAQDLKYQTVLAGLNYRF